MLEGEHDDGQGLFGDRFGVGGQALVTVMPRSQTDSVNTDPIAPLP